MGIGEICLTFALLCYPTSLVKPVMLTIMPDHVACIHAQFCNSAMAEAADIAVDTDYAWLVQICFLCTCNVMNIAKNSFREINYSLGY